MATDPVIWTDPGTIHGEWVELQARRGPGLHRSGLEAGLVVLPMAPRESRLCGAPSVSLQRGVVVSRRSRGASGSDSERPGCPRLADVLSRLADQLSVLAAIPLLGALGLAGLVFTAPLAAASAPTCPPGHYYTGQLSSNYANDGVAGYIQGSALAVSNPDTAHGLVYLAAEDHDPNDGVGVDSLQVGYGIGTTDKATTSTSEVYEEGADINSGGTYVAAYYSEFSMGNDGFEDYFTGSYQGLNGLYDGYIYTPSSGFVLIGQAYFDQPTSSILGAQGEAATAVSQDCPYLGGELFGTEGSYGYYDAASELYVLPRSYVEEPWGTNISTSLHVVNPPGYSTYAYTSFNEYDAFYAYGGNPDS